MTSPPVVVASFYRFAPLADYKTLRLPLLELCRQHDLLGTILLAHEGINGSLAGTEESVRTVLAHLERLPGCENLEARWSRASQPPFHRMKVRLKAEIVTLGEPDVTPLSGVGHYVDPEDWNAVIQNRDVIVIDTRNDYETQVGSFEGAIVPDIRSFREFPAWFRSFRSSLAPTNAPLQIAMFCTGGIRCEKSTAFLRSEGVETVLHLKGGILNYLERIPAEESLWTGECFVFDERVTVSEDLREGASTLCRACRRPVAPEDRLSPLFEDGASCPRCHHTTTPDQRARFRERWRQARLAEARGETHVGSAPRAKASAPRSKVRPSPRSNETS
jgi:UPF0176 protein